MKRGTILLLALSIVAAIAAAAPTRRRTFNILKRADNEDTCKRITCGESGESCASTKNETIICNPDLYCINNTCGVYVEGSPCSSSSTCPDNDNLYCNTTTKLCATRKGAGADCTASNQCQDDFWCNGTTWTEGVCLSYPSQLGDACSTYTADCPEGMKCSGSVCVSYPYAEGETCTSENDCVGDLYCNSSKMCAVLPAEGEKCGSSTSGYGSATTCADGLYCNSSSYCVAYPTEGEKCGSITNRGSTTYYCADNLYCNSSSYCVSYPGEGETCGTSSSGSSGGPGGSSSTTYYCTDGLYCNTSTVCVTLPVSGEACGTSRGSRTADKCADGLDCVSGVCLKVSGEGEACESDDNCVEGLGCISNVCSEPLSEGSACTSDGQCADDLFCNSKKVCSSTHAVGDACKVTYTFMSSYTCDEGYCNTSNKICVAYPGEGETCGAGTSSFSSSTTYYCADNLYCNSSNICVAYPGEGETCGTGTSGYGSTATYCADNLYCNSSNICVAYPGEGEKCVSTSTYGSATTCADGLYCNSSSYCVVKPGEGETCGTGTSTYGSSTTYYCGDELYCNDSNICVPYPGEGEECYKASSGYVTTYTCKTGFTCEDANEEKKRICYKSVGGEGDYCSSKILCGDGLICNTDVNKCVVGNCLEDSDCPENQGCGKFECVNYMTVEDGKECLGTFTCKQGSGCIADNKSATGYVCMKITTTLEDNIECNTTLTVCPADSTCECNTFTGNMQCVPQMYADATALAYYKRLLNSAGLSKSDKEAYEKAMSDIYTPYKEEYRCVADIPIPTPRYSSSSSLSGSEGKRKSGSYSEGSLSGSLDNESKGDDVSGRKPFAVLVMFLVLTVVSGMF